MTAVEKPLMLKDFLALDSDSCSSFQCLPRSHVATTVRFLLEADLRSCNLVRSRSRTALSKISAAIRNLPISSPTRPHPRPKQTGLLSKLTFWKRNDTVRTKDDKTPLYYPSPLATTCSSCSPVTDDDDDSSVSVSVSVSVSESSLSSTNSTSVLTALSNKVPEQEVEKENTESRCHQIEVEKEQSSPVSVLDFVFQEEDDKDDEDEDGSINEARSPCFEQSLANIERTKNQLLEKIRRFESLVVLDPMDLIENFTNNEDHISSDDEDDDDDHNDIAISSLIRKLKLVGADKKLMHDFFEEELMWTSDEKELLVAAECWFRGEGHLTAEDHGKAQIRDMERDQRWRCFEDDKEDVAADVEGRVFGSLLDDLVLDLWCVLALDQWNFSFDGSSLKLGKYLRTSM